VKAPVTAEPNESNCFGWGALKYQSGWKGMKKAKILSK
jgi:hypothetical protein